MKTFSNLVESLNPEAKWRTEKKRKSENEGTRKGEPKISPLHEIVRHKPTPSKLRTSLPTTSPPSKRRGKMGQKLLHSFIFQPVKTLYNVYGALEGVRKGLSSRFCKKVQTTINVKI